MRNIIRLFAPLLVGLTAACDPCAGVSLCGTPQVAAEGEVIWHLTGTAAVGTTVVFERSGGVALESDTLVAIADAEGRFRFEAQAAQSGSVSGRLIFHPPAPFASTLYAEEGVMLLASPVRSDRRFLGRWGVGPASVVPRVRYVGELYHRGTRRPVEGATVEVRRRGGIAVHPTELAAVSDAAGNFRFEFRALEFGEVVVDVRVLPPEVQDTFSANGMVLQLALHDEHHRFLARWGVGEHILYVGEVQWADGTAAQGVGIEFRRTGGLAIQPEVLQTTTGANGRFGLNPTTTASGTVVGDLFIRPGPPQAEVVVRGVQLASFAEDSPRFYGIWWIPRP